MAQISKILQIIKPYFLPCQQTTEKKTYHTRLTRWVDRLQPFNFTIKHLAGKNMGFTDLISRIPSG